MLAAHLARVKLEYEEKYYKLQLSIQKQEHELKNMYEERGLLESEVISLREKVEELENENSHKNLIVERDNWRKLVDNLRKESQNLRLELDKQRLRNSKLNGDKSAPDESMEKLLEENLKLKLETQEKDIQISGLKSKLNYELELKWRRKHMQKPSLLALLKKQATALS
eukprot:snap_masked-scaffold_48-processed-gene-1.114-mRNA-1 protein AED:1.00 eAED:1.00 QI:0/-1/0/0/-1/1/1/0/168